MLKLFLRLFVLLAVGYAVCLWLVGHVGEAILADRMERYNDELLRGQVYELVGQLRPLPPEQRAQRLDLIRPHYGLQLSLTDRSALSLTPKEKKKLDAGQFISREDYTEFWTPMDDPPGAQLLRIAFPPNPPLLVYANIAAYITLAALLGSVLLTWVYPHWRDLENLRTAAGLFGAGQLTARAQVSKRSSVRGLAEHFNHMADRTQELITAQRELTNAVSHELRTPISRIEFELNLLAGASDEATRQRLLAGVRSNVQELATMVSELLTYARLEHGDLQIAREAVDARSWLASVVDAARPEGLARGVACDATFNSAPDSAESMDIEPQFMARALLNMLRNACRYAKQRVQVSITLAADGYWHLCVDDDGPGIPAGDRARIFEPFTRLQQDRSRDTGGVGLGLAIVRRVAEWHQGSVEALDSPLGGARFLLKWPATTR